MDNPLVKIDPGILIWTILTFLVLMALLKWKAWGPIVAAIERREKSIRDTIDAARKEREDAVRLLEDHKKMLADARRETARMIEQGKKDADAARGELLEKARQEASDVVAQGRREIERATRTATRELRTEVANLAVAAAGRIVKVSLDEPAQKQLVEECIREIGERPDQTH